MTRDIFKERVWNRKPWLKGKTNRIRVQSLVSAVYVHSILHNSRAHYPRSYTKPLSCWTPWYFMTSALHSDEIKLEQHCIYHCASALWDLHRATRWGNSVKENKKTLNKDWQVLPANRTSLQSHSDSIRVSCSDSRAIINGRGATLFGLYL